MTEPITHALQIEQPWGWLLLHGHLLGINRDLPPDPRHVGTRLALWATEYEPGWWLLLRDYAGLQAPLPMPPAARHLGILASAELEGWVRIEGDKRVEQHRPNKPDTQFRAARASYGRFLWVLRTPRPLSGESSRFKPLRARVTDTSEFRRDLLAYAERFGTDGFLPHHLRILDELGFRAPMKGKGKCDTTGAG